MVSDDAATPSAFPDAKQRRHPDRHKKEGDDENFINSISQSWSGVLPFTGIYDKNLNLKAFWEGKRDENFFKFKIDSLLLKKG